MAEIIPLMEEENHDRDASWAVANSTARSRIDRFKAYGIAMAPTLKRALPNYCRPDQISTPGNNHSAYLDALRGYAAFIVYIYHMYHIPAVITWRRYPFVSTLFGGPAMVSVFYVISGYALGYSLLLNMHRKDEARMLNGLASSTFRRYMRLYGSSVVGLFIAMAIVRMHLYNGVYGVEVYQDTIWKQLGHWFVDVFRFCNPFARNITDVKGNDPLSSKYLPQMWTIPVEFRGSVFLFAFCTAICKLTPRTRMLAMWLVIVLSHCWQAVYIAEFISGLFIAQLSICRHPERVTGTSTLPTIDSEKPRPPQTRLSKISHSLLFSASLILLGQIDEGQGDLLIFGGFPWQYINHLIPSWWESTTQYLFWLAWGSFGLVYALEFYPTLRRPLSWKVSRYLGDISFGLYAMHVCFGMGIRTLYLEPWQKKYLGESSPAYIFIAIIITFIVVTAADYFTKLDRMVVRYSKQVQDQFFSKWN